MRGSESERNISDPNWHAWSHITRSLLNKDSLDSSMTLAEGKAQAAVAMLEKKRIQINAF